MKNREGFGLIGLVITIAIVAVVGSGGYYYIQKTDSDEEQMNNFLDVIEDAEEVVDIIEDSYQDLQNEINDVRESNISN